MEKRNSFKKKLESFFAGKGFYIVLILCIAVIGVSAWVMLHDTGTMIDTDDFEAGSDISQIPGYEEPVITITPDGEDTEIGRIEDDDSQAAVRPEETPIAVEPNTGGDSSGTSQNTSQDTGQEAAVWSDSNITSGTSIYVWPVVGEVEVPYTVTSLIYNRTMRDWRIHAGIDIAAPLGTQVLAAAAGRVENIFTDDLNGVTVVIDHTGGVKSVYSNLAETPTVNIGDNVITGQVIGSIGLTALGETGEVNHLHFSMTLDGTPINPEDYLPAR